jgi:hypothetical protein
LCEPADLFVVGEEVLQLFPKSGMGVQELLTGEGFAGVSGFEVRSNGGIDQALTLFIVWRQVFHASTRTVGAKGA